MTALAQTAMATGLPKVSVIVPAYNAAWCLERTLRSIERQTYPRYDVIVVNDGSTDGTEAIIDAVCARDGRFFKVTQSNQGLVGARNAGIEHSDGELVAPIDADDLWAPDYLSKLVAALAASDPAAPFAFCHSVWIDEDDRLLADHRPTHVPATDFLALLRENAVGNGSASVFRRSALDAVGGYDPSLKKRGALGGEDWKLSLLLTARHPAIFVNDALVGYRLMPQSLSADPAKQSKSLLIVLDDIARAFPAVPKQVLREARSDFAIWLLPRFARSGNWPGFLRHLAMAYLFNPAALASAKHRHALKRLMLGGWRASAQASASGPDFWQFAEASDGGDLAARPAQ